MPLERPEGPRASKSNQAALQTRFLPWLQSDFPRRADVYMGHHAVVYMRMDDRDRILVWLLRLGGASMLMALGAVVMPFGCFKTP